MKLLVDHEDVLRRANELPPLPQSAARLAGMLFDEDADTSEMVRIIECDPALTLKLLKVANSALGGARHRIGTIREAVVRLGTGIVAGFALGNAVRPLVQQKIPGYNLTGSDFWRHSLLSAFAAESIQAHATNWSSPLAFTAGLLHDIGKLTLGTMLTKEMANWLEQAVVEGKQPLYRAELEILSLHHGDVGGLIAQHWNLPDVLVGGIVNHHTPALSDDPVSDAIYLADLTAHRLRAERSAEVENSVPPSWEVWDIGPSLARLGMTEQDLQNVLGDARKRMEDISGETD